MQGCDQDATGNADTLRNVIMFMSCAVIAQTITLGKNDNQPGGFSNMRLVGDCTDWLERGQPFIAATAIIKCLFLDLG